MIFPDTLEGIKAALKEYAESNSREEALAIVRKYPGGSIHATRSENYKAIIYDLGFETPDGDKV